MLFRVEVYDEEDAYGGTFDGDAFTDFRQVGWPEGYKLDWLSRVIIRTSRRDAATGITWWT